jgi:single-stranded-DNA-specific exonuclease
MKVVQRPTPGPIAERFQAAGIHPLLARLFAARGLTTPNDTEDALKALLPPEQMKNLHEAAMTLANAIEKGQRLLVIADYDADGATACAIAVRGLKRFGAEVNFLVPDRFAFGYGLTPALVMHALEKFGTAKPDWIITVDNGISSIDGVACAQAHGVEVLVTDHHLPGPVLPSTLIVNPNQPDCPFPSKHLAGVGVMFYVLLALRAVFRDQKKWPPEKCPRLDDLLPIVALGTVADVVRLDANNRRLVSQGLQRLRTGQSFAGLNALFSVAGIDVQRATPNSLGFSIGPRINAAGRLGDMSIGIQCLLEDDPRKAAALAATLDEMNRTRREIEGKARDEALAQASQMIRQQPEFSDERFSLVLHDPQWHQGVVGLIAGKLKEHFHRPVIIFASDTQQPDQLKGSGRSIPGIHLRDVLERIDTQHPGMIRAFGGHAMAAGLTLDRAQLESFILYFESTVQTFADPTDLQRLLEHDGPLEETFLRLDIAHLLEQQVWGQGFPAPVFCNHFRVLSQRRLQDKHLKLTLALGSATTSSGPATRIEAIWFNATQDLPESAHLAYRLATNHWQGTTQLQLEIVSAV